MVSRRSKILEYVSEHKKVEVSKLAEILNVSQVTIRKDLDILVDKGLLKREHGYAQINSIDDINNRLAVKYDIKRKIARLAATMVDDGDTVIIESGSCCALLAEELSKRDVKIITNSAFIAGYIRESPYCRVILIGGDYQPKSQVTVGPLAIKSVQEFFVDKLFTGIDGFSIDKGFTGSDLMRVETVKAMRRSAKKAIILTDSSKFHQQGILKQFEPEDINFVFTDSGIDKNIKKYLEEKGINVKTTVHQPD